MLAQAKGEFGAEDSAALGGNPFCGFTHTPW